MPMNRKQYPPHWNEISLAVRERANWRCEWCSAIEGAIHPKGWFVVRLQAAHVHDPDPRNCHEDNLAALCALCHTRHDSAQHVRTRRINRVFRQLAAGQIPLIPPQPMAFRSLPGLEVL